MQLIHKWNYWTSWYV